MEAQSGNPAATPTPVTDVQGDGRWMSMHNKFIREAKAMSSTCELLFIGDSIIFGLKDTETWETLFKPYGALNFGIGGDTTENVLWRIRNGELENLAPKVVVVLVGTNNVSRCPLHTAANIAEGIEAIAWYINGACPQTKIIILGILPRGESPNPLRVKIRDINSQVKSAATSMPNTMYLDIDPGFIGENDHKISEKYMGDYLHPTRLAYAKMCPILHEAIVKLTKYQS